MLCEQSRRTNAEFVVALFVVQVRQNLYSRAGMASAGAGAIG
jgi:hypothetical protein